RLSDSNEVEARNKARSLAEQTQGKPLYYYWNPVSTPSPYYGKQVVSYRFNYYLSIHRDEVIPILSEKIRGPYFISQRWNADKEKDIEILDEFQPAGHDSPLLLFIFTNQ
ncbi:MAG: hypothetical protein K8S16_19825, partial [Bacteroidales bacterium]|nr:hypothetical protein [Bacteroidales bacterium]